MDSKFDRQKFREGFLQKLAEQGISPSEFGEMCCQAPNMQKEANNLLTFLGSLGKVGIAGLSLGALLAVLGASKTGKAIAGMSSTSPSDYIKTYQTLELAKAYENAADRVKEKDEANKLSQEKGYDTRVMSDAGF